MALLAPGQGAQTPGMLAPWLDLPFATARLRWYSALTGLDLVRLGTRADAEEIRDTAVTQPLIVALGLLAAAELPVAEVGVAAGHSVGELTAAAVAGALRPDTAIALAGLRGREMAAACGRAETGMSAVLGGDPEEVLARITELGLTAANRNGAGQVVAAGPLVGLAALAERPPQRARVVPLSVAGAFHTGYMAEAEANLAAVRDGVDASDPGILLLSNTDGTAVTEGRQLLHRLVGQVIAPVRWDLCQATLRDLGVTAVIELPPAGALAGLAKRELKGVDILTIKTPDDLAAAADLITRSAPVHQAQHTPDWRVVVSPVRGSVDRADHAVGTALTGGAPLGTIRSRRDDVAVLTPYGGVLAEWLVEDGDLVDAGDPLVRLVPAGQS